VTAKRSAQLGFTVVIAPSVTGAEAMLDALNAYFAGGVDIASP